MPEFSEAMKALDKGQMTEAPVKSQFGWHIIRVDDIRQAQLPPIEQFKPADPAAPGPAEARPVPRGTAQVG